MGLEVVKDNTEEAVDAIGSAIAAALEEVGLAAEGYAKAICPVDTGRLRNSITHVARPDEKAVYIGTNVFWSSADLTGNQTAQQAGLYQGGFGAVPI
ncbi:MAG: HK97 gp10 family phage protein [Collinsella sp.]|nr:HK97 gp10 family phage protein [Collinsella sp.]